MRLDAKGLRKLRYSLWAILAAVSLIFAAVSILSAVNYTDIAYAKLAVNPRASMNVTAAGLGPSGEILNATVFTLRVDIYVDNPSSRQIKFQMLTYQCKLRDYLNETYYPALVENQTYEKDTGLVDPGENKSFTAPPSGAPWTFSLASSPATFPGAQTILNYALTHKGYRWNESEWDHIFVFTLIVTGVPTEYYGANSGYLIELPVVHRTQVIVQGGRL